jgi:hypothetical protein
VRGRRPFNPSPHFGGNHCTYYPARHLQSLPFAFSLSLNSYFSLPWPQDLSTMPLLAARRLPRQSPSPCPTEGGTQGLGRASGASGSHPVERILDHLGDIGGESRDAEGAWSSPRRLCAILECHHPSSWSESVGIIRSRLPRCCPMPSLCLAFLPLYVSHGLESNLISIYGAIFTRGCTMAPICSLGWSVSPLGRRESTLSSQVIPPRRALERNCFTLILER